MALWLCVKHLFICDKQSYLPNTTLFHYSFNTQTVVSGRYDSLHAIIGNAPFPQTIVPGSYDSLPVYVISMLLHANCRIGQIR